MPTIIKTFTSSQGGVKNYLSTRSSSFSGWTNVGTGATGSTTTTAAELPELSVGTALKVTNGGSGSGYVESDFFQVDASDLGKLLGLTYNLETSASPAYAANNFQIQVWDATTSGGVYAQNTTLNVANIPSSPTGGTMQLSFSQNPSRPFTRIRIVRVAGLANSWASFSSITVTSATGGQSAAISEWQSLTLTPSSGWGTPANQVYYYKRDGSDAIFSGTFQAGTTSGNPATIGLPPGLSINAAAVPASARGRLGRFELASSATALISSTDREGVLFYNGTNSDRLAFAIRSTTTGYETGNASSIAASSSYVMFEARVPIAEWAGSGTVNLGAGAQVEYAWNSDTTDASTTASGFSYGPSGVVFGSYSTANRTKRVRFQYPIQTDDILQLEILRNGQWQPVEVSEFKSLSSTTGIDLRPVSGSTTDVDVIFGSAGYPATLGGGSNTWSAIAGSSGFGWRVRKVKASSPVGFGLVNSSESGLQRGYSSMTRIRLNTGNGFGSTNTTIRRFTNTVVNTGSGITYADSSTAGASFTVTEAGIYSFSYSDAFNGAAAFGISLNSSQLTTSVASITATDRLCMSVASAADLSATVSVTLSLSVGDVIRPHASGAESAVPGRTQFTVQRIA